MLKTTPAGIAAHLHTMATDLDDHGIWTGGPAFVDAATGRLDIPAAAYRAVTGTLPFLFYVATPDGADAARIHFEINPAVLAVLDAIAAHMATVRPDADWLDDPIERLSLWPDLLGVDVAEITQTLRDLADTLAAPAAEPVAA
ncbi:hypothetical protein ACIA7S_28585 [Streptomyces sp. NPDC051643]|uniref:hypothetical protein n=1 Tax=Streptomyces sp. NPDC051643 TaxID=3365665 RepID=UPI0037B411CD